jgi:hypothetical protein
MKMLDKISKESPTIFVDLRKIKWTMISIAIRHRRINSREMLNPRQTHFPWGARMRGERIGIWIGYVYFSLGGGGGGGGGQGSSPCSPLAPPWPPVVVNVSLAILGLSTRTGASKYS